MKSYVGLLFILSISVLLTACAENINTIHFVELECPHQKDTTNTGEVHTRKSSLLFNASVESINSTKSLSPMRKNQIAEILVFKNNPLQLSEPYKVVNYKTITAGMLSPMNKDTLYLPEGTYSLYSLSDNSSGYPPESVNGITEPLKSGVDYLWWKTENFQIAAPVVVVPVFYVHCATQVVIKLKPGNGVRLNKLLSTRIYPSANGAQMSLSDGVIPQTDKYAKEPAEMGVSDFVAQYTMLPLKTNKRMTAYFTVLINDELKERTFKTEIKLPVKGLEAGHSYLYEAVINANTIQFTHVNVIDWIVVDQTGRPLYPSQI